MKKYFKCHICKWIVRKRYNECVLHSLKEGELPLCKYNTFFSIWKWIVRLLHIPLGFITYLIIWRFIKWYINCWRNILTLLSTNVGVWTTIGNWIFTICHVIILIGIIWGIHSTFCDRGGTYYNEK